MNEPFKSSSLSSWGIFFLVAIGFAAMVIFMMRGTGDNHYQATAEVTLHTEPAADAPAVETIAAGAVLLCHGADQAQPDWLDCSDMIERKYARADAVQAISEAAYQEAKRNQLPGARD